MLFWFAGVGAAVLQALDVEVAAHISLDLVGFDDRALQRGVAAAGDADLLTGLDLGVGVEGVCTVAPAFAAAGAGVEQQAAGAVADAYAA
jgi:hypothetical protein